jgi:S1-C subfamily serine protease
MRVTAFFVALGVLTGASPIQAPSRSSIVHVTIKIDETVGRCSGFCVNSEKGNFITAGHCLGDELKIDGKNATIIAQDHVLDIAVITLGEPVNVAALQLGKQPRFRDKLELLGFPLSSPQLFSIPVIFQGDFYMTYLEPDRAVMIGSSMPGMSGGPILNSTGKVVGMVNGGGNPSLVVQDLTYGAMFKTLKKFYLLGQL